MAGAYQRAMRRTSASRAGSRTYRAMLPVLDRLVRRVTGGRHTFTAHVIPTLVLETVGARSGLPREQPLCFLRDGADLVVVGSNWGQEHHPAWTANLLAHPAARVHLGGRVRDVTAVPVREEGEWERLYGLFETLSPNYRSYRAWAGPRQPRLFRLVAGGPRRRAAVESRAQPARVGTRNGRRPAAVPRIVKSCGDLPFGTGHRTT